MSNDEVCQLAPNELAVLNEKEEKCHNACIYRIGNSGRCWCGFCDSCEKYWLARHEKSQNLEDAEEEEVTEDTAEEEQLNEPSPVLSTPECDSCTAWWRSVAELSQLYFSTHVCENISQDDGSDGNRRE